MKKMKISPPAFPTYLADNMAHGMSLRDYFAAAALQSFLSRDSLDQLSQESITYMSYKIADEMMKAREE
jgi:hypothetical protein